MGRSYGEILSDGTGMIMYANWNYFEKRQSAEMNSYMPHVKENLYSPGSILDKHMLEVEGYVERSKKIIWRITILYL